MVAAGGEAGAGGGSAQVLTRRISDHVKLVGPTISCEGIQPQGMPLRKNPHVQSFVVATDQARPRGCSLPCGVKGCSSGS